MPKAIAERDPRAHGQGYNPWRQSLCEESLRSATGRRNRLPHHGKPSRYRTVGQRFRPSNDFSNRLVSQGTFVSECFRLSACSRMAVQRNRDRQEADKRAIAN